MAAAVFIPPSPHDPLTNMSTTSRRAPLANIANATNSPHRVLTYSGSKRSRAVANLNLQENEPPSKKVAVEKDHGEPIITTGRRRLAPPQSQPQPQPMAVESRVFERGTGETGSTVLHRRLVAARDRTAHTKTGKTAEQTQREIESIRQWQKHYRKLFPTFSFYFDSVPDELQARFTRNIRTFGSRVEAFFSKNVTHIVTTRPVPSEAHDPRSPDTLETPDVLNMNEQSQTINPSLLERQPSSRPPAHGAEAIRRDAPMDILTRGRQMGMKIWAVEKLHRVLTSMMEDPAAQAGQTKGTQPLHGRAPEDLSQVLKNEKIGTVTEREQISMPREVVPFKGPFIYIHDMDEKMRPTMIREYPKVTRRQDGEWPQFRSATIGKCPFVEDLSIRKDEQERTKHKALLQQQAKVDQTAGRTRSAHVAPTSKMEPPTRISNREPLQHIPNTTLAAVNPKDTLKPKPAPGKLERQSSFPPMPEQPPPSFVHPAQMHLGREPAASGIQRSAVTSAIQSQMISSTAATGIRATTSKDVHELKRKVLEKTHTGSLSMGSISSSARMNDLVGALKNARAPAPQRTAKSKAQEKLGGIQEETDPYADDIAAERQANATSRKKKKTAKRDPKPGYCENCRDKYDDFEEHVVSRKHRKFATTQSNWDELDALLLKLQTT